MLIFLHFLLLQHVEKVAANAPEHTPARVAFLGTNFVSLNLLREEVHNRYVIMIISSELSDERITTIEGID